jgi:hypothetical protein
MLWAHVENGVVDYRGALPKIWRNISSLNLADPEKLRSLGWLPLTIIEPAVPGGHVRTGPIETISHDGVTLEYSYRPMTDNELYDQNMSIWKNGFHREEIPRWAEDLYDAMPPEVQNKVEKITRDAIERKKLHRAKKPVS